MGRQKRDGLPTFTHDPTGELHGIPTYIWGRAPEGLATRRQLAERGLRKNGQSPAAWIRRGSLIGFLYRVDLAAPQFAKTQAKMAAVHTAARARRRCVECGPIDYIPRQAEPCWGRCWNCMGLPTPEPNEE